ncbi:tetratricopeptide repeat protein [Ochrovirga pacifica]|uniref:tetratricopeptide repeat protein n=1 Tax=Ochrovirga pacifica TaxID=1042376 RepID=UPI0004950E98|nr:hypothetical protein [Ochrovirga pacifica]
MKKIKKYFLFVSFVLFSCHQEKKDVVQLQDLNPYLQNQQDQALQKIHQNKKFWEEKLSSNPNQFPYAVKIAGLETQLFSKTGNIQHLKNAEKQLTKAVTASGRKKSSYLRSLARNYISQHQFKKALDLLLQAESNGDQKQETIKMLFDVYLELGDDKNAEIYLGKIKDKRSFDYLIRLAKWEDHHGNLDATIAYMEEALKTTQQKKHTDLEQWSLTNLADYYGHHGEIEKSYNYYLKALEKNPNNYYALRKIAWISYANDKDPKEANTILTQVYTKYQGLDIDLLAYEIAKYQNQNSEELLAKYWNEVQNSAYGEMYNMYNFDLLIAEKEYQKAYQIALKEVNNRPTDAAYSMLALAKAHVDTPDKGMEILKEHNVVESSEPKVLLRVAKIYSLKQHKDALEIIRHQLQSASFELGPLAMNELNQL